MANDAVDQAFRSLISQQQQRYQQEGEGRVLTVKLSRKELGDCHVEKVLSNLQLLMKCLISNKTNTNTPIKILLRRNNITDLGASRLLEALTTTLASLLVTFVSVDGNASVSLEVTERLAGYTSVNQLIYLEHIKDIDGVKSLTSRNLGDHGVTAVVDYLRVAVPDNTPVLTCIGLGKNGIGEEGAQALTRLFAAPQAPKVQIITKLEVYSNRKGAFWAECAATIMQGNRTLRCLDIGGNAIGDPGAHELAKALPYCALHELHIDYNDITDEGGQCLATALAKNSSLVRLWYHGNCFSEVTANRIASALCANDELTRAFNNKLSLDDIVSQRKVMLQERAANFQLSRHSLLCSRLPSTTTTEIADVVAKLCINAYLTECKHHSMGIDGQVVLSGIVQQTSSMISVVALGVGTRFAPSSTMNINTKGVKTTLRDSHAEVLARRCFERYLGLEALAAISRGTSSIFTLGEDDNISLLPHVQFHMYTSTAPCGRYEVDQVYVKGGTGSTGVKPHTDTTCEPLSCADKIARWNKKGIQGGRLVSLLGKLHLSLFVIGRKYCPKKCSFLCARELGDGIAEVVPTSVRLESMVGSQSRADGDSDVCMTWTAGLSDGPERHDGKTGLTFDAKPSPICSQELEYNFQAIRGLVEEAQKATNIDQQSLQTPS